MQLNIATSVAEQALEVSNAISNKLQQIIKEKCHAVLAVSGGKSPIQIFDNLSKVALDWTKVTITLVDERIVATDDPDSNENLVKSYLLKNNATNAKFIGLYNAQLPLDQNITKLKIAIDIAILGMGEDGHTASIFPDCPELDQALTLNSSSQYIKTTPFSAKYQRISLTLEAILNIKHLILSISGNLKLNIIKEAYTNSGSSYPIGHVIRNRPDTQIYWSE